MSADISRSKCLLYRGSSVVLNAVSCGLHPIYLMLKNETSIDPLYFVSSGRDIVSNMDEFKHCLKKKSNIDCKDKMTHLCKRMYTPLNVTVIDSLI